MCILEVFIRSHCFVKTIPRSSLLAFMEMQLLTLELNIWPWYYQKWIYCRTWSKYLFKSCEILFKRFKWQDLFSFIKKRSILVLLTYIFSSNASKKENYIISHHCITLHYYIISMYFSFFTFSVKFNKFTDIGATKLSAALKICTGMKSLEWVSFIYLFLDM